MMFQVSVCSVSIVNVLDIQVEVIHLSQVFVEVSMVAAIPSVLIFTICCGYLLTSCSILILPYKIRKRGFEFLVECGR